MLNIALLLLWLPFPNNALLSQNYTVQAPASMISIVYVNHRFAATDIIDKTFGDFLENRIEESVRTDVDILNQEPGNWYVLFPDDTVRFLLPVKPDEEILTLYTGRHIASADKNSKW